LAINISKGINNKNMNKIIFAAIQLTMPFSGTLTLKVYHNEAGEVTYKLVRVSGMEECLGNMMLKTPLPCTYRNDFKYQTVIEKITKILLEAKVKILFTDIFNPSFEYAVLNDLINEEQIKTLKAYMPDGWRYQRPGSSKSIDIVNSKTGETRFIRADGMIRS
jgi:hypothetical protein